MATTFTPNLKLGKPAAGDLSWGSQVWNPNADALEVLAPLAGCNVSCYEVPSTSLRVGVAPGSMITPWGSLVSFAGSAPVALTASATTYVYLTAAGVLTVNTTGFPTGGTPYVPLATVVTSGTAVNSITDARAALRCVIPTTQPTMGAATAGATYTAAEQAMLQAVYNAVRTLGLGT